MTTHFISAERKVMSWDWCYIFCNIKWIVTIQSKIKFALSDICFRFIAVSTSFLTTNTSASRSRNFEIWAAATEWNISMIPRKSLIQTIRYSLLWFIHSVFVIWSNIFAFTFFLLNKFFIFWAWSLKFFQMWTAFKQITFLMFCIKIDFIHAIDSIEGYHTYGLNCVPLKCWFQFYLSLNQFLFSLFLFTYLTFIWFVAKQSNCRFAC